MDIIEFKKKYGTKTASLLIDKALENLKFLSENSYYQGEMNETRYKETLKFINAVYKMSDDLYLALENLTAE